MENYPFIFSDEKPYRLRRHVLFWFCWWMFQSFLYSFAAGLMNASYFRRLPVSAVEALFYLLPHMFLAYSLMYWVVPRLVLTGKYLQAALSAGLLFLATGALSISLSMYFLTHVRALMLGRFYVPPTHINELHFFLGLLAGLRGAITIGGLAAAIKLMKHWYVKEQRNLQLQKENISSQLQLLKAQVHPHFLFNTLNNIYSSTQVTSPKAATMIMGLSNLLRYILYECNQPTVSLRKELQMLREYMHLEQRRYDNNLELHVQLPEEDTGLAIAPLLLLPFVENSFKHGASQMLDQPWISLQMSVENDWLKMKLLNAKTSHTKYTHSGIGLHNVKKRLELLYPQKHELIITEEEEVFIANLKILLERTSPVTSPARKPAETYA